MIYAWVVSLYPPGRDRGLESLKMRFLTPAAANDFVLALLMPYDRSMTLSRLVISPCPIADLALGDFRVPSSPLPLGLARPLGEVAWLIGYDH